MLEIMISAIFNNTTGIIESSERLGTSVSTTRPVAVDIQLKLYNIIIPLLGVLIIGLNLAIVISSGLILHRGQQPRSTYLFLGNVALSDLLIGLAILFGHFYPVEHRHEMTCCIQMGMTVSAIIVSIYSIGLIAIDRYLYILYGLQHQRYIYSNRARLMILLTWILGLIVGFLPAMGLRTDDTDNGRLCWFIILTPPYLVIITTTIGVIPLGLVIVLYSIILKQALKKISELKIAAEYNKGLQTGNLRLFRGGQNSRDSTLSIVEEVITQYQTDDKEDEKLKRRSKMFKWFKRSQSKTIKLAPVYNPSKWKAIKIVLYTTGAFFVTWFPFFIASAMFAVCNPETTPVYCDKIRVAITSPLTILGLTNSLLNPIVYAWWHNGFRESVKKMYYGIFGKRCQNNLNAGQEATTSSSRNSRVAANTPGTSSEVDNSDTEQRIINRINNTELRGSNENNENSGNLKILSTSGSAGRRESLRRLATEKSYSTNVLEPKIVT